MRLIVPYSRTAILLLLVITQARSAEADELADIRRAWASHLAAVKSIQFDCKIERHTNTEDASPFGEAGTPLPTTPGPITLNGRVSFMLAGEKVACTRVAEFWSDVHGRQLKTQKRSFDGRENRVLFTGGKIALAEVKWGRLPDDALAMHIELTPLWGSVDPTHLLRIDRGEVAVDPRDVDGVRCLALSKADPNAPITRILYVDPARAFLPVRFQTKFKGKLRSDDAFDYNPHDEVGWTLATWTSRRFEEDMGPGLAIRGVVKKCTVNGEIPDAAFKCEFPAGAHVSTPKGFFIQQIDGSLREITQEEYGRIREAPRG